MTLYSTLGCHLCEQAEALLIELAQSEPLQWQVVDIVEDDELMEQYAIRIPVLRATNTTEDLGWPFTLDDVRRYIRTNAD
ncbi:hypothetical protein BGP77_04205 [Saccharospirillum sp. MSK14-1]|nr:hypothetical protein BGP77_04205 [Saccharospirillum sp. MSK14-1]